MTLIKQYLPKDDIELSVLCCFYSSGLCQHHTQCRKDGGKSCCKARYPLQLFLCWAYFDFWHENPLLVEFVIGTSVLYSSMSFISLFI